jgi:Skp family chaperone for outer membrane proteins
MKTCLHNALCMLALGLALVAKAQDDELAPLPEGRIQEIKAQRTAFLTQRLDLTPAEAEKFWPVFNQYDKEIEAVRKDMREQHRSLRKDGELSESEASAVLDKELASRQKELDIRKKYAAEFKRTIGAVRTVKLGKAERDFHRELLKRMRDRMEDRRGGTGPGGRPGRR